VIGIWVNVIAMFLRYCIDGEIGVMLETKIRLRDNTERQNQNFFIPLKLNYLN
jgi:hypothetical protein